jgi:hypothetical protein
MLLSHLLMLAFPLNKLKCPGGIWLPNWHPLHHFLMPMDALRQLHYNYSCLLPKDCPEGTALATNLSYIWCRNFYHHKPFLTLSCARLVMTAAISTQAWGDPPKASFDCCKHSPSLHERLLWLVQESPLFAWETVMSGTNRHRWHLSE